MNRRRFLSLCGAAGLAGYAVPGWSARAASTPRTFHVCMCPEGLEADPERLALFAQCGITDVWVGAFFYGHWPAPPERIQYWLEQIRKAGMRAHAANIPLGHPGNSLGSSSPDFPLTPGKQWRDAVRPDGTRYSGTSLHPPATEDNIAALKQLRDFKVDQVFLDDDFRLATGPGVIGGCFCDEHRRTFLEKHGYSEARWNELLADVRGRKLTPIVRAWVEMTCDELTGCFRAQQKAVPEIRLGSMVMYLGAEKAGIRLKDYVGAPMRVGELMFDDRSFSQVKGKCDELFSALFHRRFFTPELAYSETTAYPADKLSAKNMAAKLAVSTLSDVRHTMFMSGATPFPREHWATLTPAMKKQAALHAKVAGQRPRGPFKHYWGEWSRYVGDDKPYSLFLATGVPFEVTDKPAHDGWTFLSTAEAEALKAGQLRHAGTQFVTRAEVPGQTRGVDESLEALFALKHELLPKLGKKTPYVEEDRPVVCGWYPQSRRVLLWNLAEERVNLTLRLGDRRWPVEIGGLDTVLIENVA